MANANDGPMSDHWADKYAFQIVRQKGPKEIYVCASGITPSGTVHIGNFREIISVELVVRALRDRAENARFIYSWDDFDVFRKVPQNIPNHDALLPYLRRPITHVPDPNGSEVSFARANEVAVEAVLHRLGVDPEYLYQAEKYASGIYADGMKRALERRESIRAILDSHRSEPLDAEWMPLSVFCSSCDRDTTRVEGWDGEWQISYECESCGNSERIDLRESKGAKLPWRTDWPMRWRYEAVDFEPAGKEHHSAGGSFDTAKEIVRAVYDTEPPVTFKYDFISIKGLGGKISSSIGNVVSLEEVLTVYQPEIVRYLFAGTRPDTEFSISFDLDVIKIYEDYDRCERVYYGLEEIGEKKRAKSRRTYELSQVDAPESNAPPQLSFRHLCNLLQIHSGDLIPARDALLADAGVAWDSLNDSVKRRLDSRVECAWNWIPTHAPEEFRFALRSVSDGPIEVSDDERDMLSSLFDRIKDFDRFDEKRLGELFYEIAEAAGSDPKSLFGLMYRVLLGKERGPRLAAFILTVGHERILPLLDLYRKFPEDC